MTKCPDISDRLDLHINRGFQTGSNNTPPSPFTHVSTLQFKLHHFLFFQQHAKQSQKDIFPYYNLTMQEEKLKLINQRSCDFIFYLSSVFSNNVQAHFLENQPIGTVAVK